MTIIILLIILGIVLATPAITNREKLWQFIIALILVLFITGKAIAHEGHGWKHFKEGKTPMCYGTVPCGYGIKLWYTNESKTEAIFVFHDGKEWHWKPSPNASCKNLED